LQTGKALSGNRGTVLVVEPEIMKFKYVEMFLIASGFSAQHAVNIQQGIDHISKTTGFNALIVNKTVFDETNEDEIKQIKIASTGLPMILIDNYDELMHILDTVIS
jgi:DNA-binding NtrC family response regulator